MMNSFGLSGATSLSAAQLNAQVYCHPKQLEFFLDDVSSHKAVVSVYNPYDFPVKFKVLSTAPKKYTVTDPEGVVSAKSSVNLIIKHNSQAFQSENVIDKLRIQIYQAGVGSGSPANKPNLICKRDIPLYSVVSREAHVLALMTSSKHKMDISGDELSNKYSSSSFAYGNNLSDMIASTTTTATTSNSLNRSPGLQKSNLSLQKNVLLMQQPADNVNYLVIVLGLIGLGVLCLPLTGTTDSFLPVYMHVTHEIKLITAFILGMITMVILKT